MVIGIVSLGPNNTAHRDTYKDPAFSKVPQTVKVGGRIEDEPQCYRFSLGTLPGQLYPMGRSTSAVNITKGSEKKAVKELQPGVIRSCCREDRHPNNQINIKSKATTKYLQMLIYYRVEGRACTDHVCICMAIDLAVDKELYPKT